jgi:hypothetical protein
MPIFSSKRDVLSPIDAIRVLTSVGNTVSSSRVCQRQPIGVSRHSTFIVDLHSLKSVDDVKCDDVGSWHNNSCNKFKFVQVDREYKLVDKKTPKQYHTNEVGTLKRSYFTLRGGDGDFRRRIDTIDCK